MTQFLKELQDDCAILLNRALRGKTLACFGVDGGGKYGYSHNAQNYNVFDVLVELTDNEDDDVPFAVALLMLDEYDANQFGHLVTDQNLKFSLNRLLKEQEIQPACWDWADISLQTQHIVVLKLKVDKLIEWL